MSVSWTRLQRLSRQRLRPHHLTSQQTTWRSGNWQVPEVMECYSRRVTLITCRVIVADSHERVHSCT
jgi:hypothetical protein